MESLVLVDEVLESENIKSILAPLWTTKEKLLTFAKPQMKTRT